MKTIAKIMMVMAIALVVACSTENNEKANVIAKIDAYKAAIEMMKADTTTSCCSTDTVAKESCCSMSCPIIDTVNAYETAINEMIEGGKLVEADKAEVMTKFNEVRLAANTMLVDYFSKANEGCMTKMNEEKASLEAAIAAFTKKTPKAEQDSINAAKAAIEAKIAEVMAAHTAKIDSLKKVAEAFAPAAATTEAPAATEAPATEAPAATEAPVEEKK